MAIKPILFNTEMVRAILDDRKTQTRRLVKPRYRKEEGGFQVCTNMATGQKWVEKTDWDEGSFDPTRYVNPPCQPGDILWVRETWDRYVDGNTGEIVYIYKTHCRNRKILEDVGGYQIKWRPSIHMPREAARIFLKVKFVRVSRLHDYFDASCAYAEGIAIDHPHSAQEAVDEFIKLWNSTVKPAGLQLYGWDANPWVWVIGFERIDGKPAI